jgi:hypothetical protein
MLAGLRFAREAGHGRDVPLERGLVRTGTPAIQRTLTVITNPAEDAGEE